MKNAGRKGGRFLKILHVCCIAVWFGSVMSWAPLVFGLDGADFREVQTTYLNMRSIAWNVIGWGGISSLFSGLLLVTLTKWSLLKHRWAAVKFIAIIGLIFFGMFFMEEWMLRNVELLKNGQATTLNDQAFQSNHNSIKMGLVAEFLAFTVIIGISVFKPRFRRQ